MRDSKKLRGKRSEGGHGSLVTPSESGALDAQCGEEGERKKEDCFADCTSEGADDFLDLTMKFDTQAVFDAIGPVEDRECLLLEVTGNLKAEFGGAPIRGEDVVQVICRSRN